MMTDDKYGICNAIDWHFRNQGILEVSDRIFAIKCVASIWEEVYVKMPLKDTEDNDVESLLQAIKTQTGESALKIEQSCGLFQQLKLTLSHGTWYLERARGGYYILPEYRAGRRSLTRLDADVAADLILTFDQYIPHIFSRADEELRRRKKAMMAAEIIQSSVKGIIMSLIKAGRIQVPGKPYVRGINPNKIHIYFENSPKVTTCCLEKVEERIIKKYGKEQ
jgi:hypothetical protein